MSEESHYKVLRIQKEGNYSLAFKSKKKTFPHDFLIFSSLGHTTKVLFFKGRATYLFTILSASPKMCVRGHEAQQMIIFQFIMHRCKIRIIGLTESLKRQIWHCQSIINLCIHLKQRSVLLLVFSFICRKLCFR